MKRVLENIPEELRSHEVLRESLTVQDRMVHVMDRLRGAPDAALLFEELLVDGETTRHRVVITFLAILSPLTNLLYYHALTRVSPHRAAAFMNLIPIIVMVFSARFLGEAITMVQITGTVFVIGGVVMTTYTPKT